MAADRRSSDASQAELWQAIERRGIGMLELTSSGLHAQPMVAFVERRRKRLWFIARTDTDLVRSIGEGGCCAFVVQDGDLLASVAGALCVVDDRRRLARYWTPAVAAWLPEGRRDPRLTLLRMDCVDAEVWLSALGPTRLSWEIAWAGPQPRLAQFGRSGHPTLH
jgi:general stress protein 26